MSQSSASDVTTLSQSLAMTARMAYWSARHRWVVLLLSVAAIAMAMFAQMSLGTEILEGGGVGDSGKGADLLVEHFDVAPAEGKIAVSGRTERIIFSNPSLDADDPAFQASVDTLTHAIQNLPLVTSAFSYYDTGDSSMLAGDRHAVLTIVRTEDPSVEHSEDIDIQPVLDAVKQASGSMAGFEVGIVSSQLIQDQITGIFEEDLQRIMFVSLVFGLGVLLLAFRALVAAVIPLAMALGAIFTALGITAVISQFYAFAESYAEVLTLMGLAVGIDYSFS